MNSSEVPWIVKLVNFYFYSSLHIGIAAVALTYQSELLWNTELPFPYYIFVFASTILTYSAHRLVGIRMSREFVEIGRFAVINTYKNHIVIYAVFSFIAVIWAYFQLPWTIKLWLIIPAILCALYTLPILANNQRLRDFDYIKIFLIAGVWCLITQVIPVVLSKGSIFEINGLVYVERFLFIFAITIPFDIRDTQVDKSSAVKTIPLTLGNNMAIRIAVGMLLTCMICHVYFYRIELLSPGFFWALIAFYTISIPIIFHSTKQLHDYYFTGLIDGLMIVSALFCIAVEYLVS